MARSLQKRISVVVVAVCVCSVLAFCQDRDKTTTDAGKSVSQSHLLSVPEWLPVRIPVELYGKWRKYGPWDYKQQGFKYRDYTLFNFGATASATGLDQQSVLMLAKASKPTPEDVEDLVHGELQAGFVRDFEALDKLRAMFTDDSRLIRVAPDFTWLEGNNKWPRDDIGVSSGRWDEYRDKFKRLSLTEGIVRSEDYPGTIFFIVRAKGLCTGGSSNGYAYSLTKLSPTTESPQEELDLQARGNPKRHYAYAFSLLKANWYAFYEIDW
jgi:hypothetical protein